GLPRLRWRPAASVAILIVWRWLAGQHVREIHENPRYTATPSSSGAGTASLASKRSTAAKILRRLRAPSANSTYRAAWTPRQDESRQSARRASGVSLAHRTHRRPASA